MLAGKNKAKPVNFGQCGTKRVCGNSPIYCKKICLAAILLLVNMRLVTGTHCIPCGCSLVGSPAGLGNLLVSLLEAKQKALFLKAAASSAEGNLWGWFPGVLA